MKKIQVTLAQLEAIVKLAKQARESNKDITDTINIIVDEPTMKRLGGSMISANMKRKDEQSTDINIY